MVVIISTEKKWDLNRGFEKIYDLDLMEDSE